MPNIIIQKYGGTSVGTTEKIKNVADRIIKAKKDGNQVVVVVSAMGQTTDELLKLAGEISDNSHNRELDMLLTAGERISMSLLTMALIDKGFNAVSFTGSQVGLITDCTHTRAKILDIKGDRVKKALDKGNIVIVAGFQGVSTEKEVTTLGRGGSDTTAVALAACLKADLCEIYTDVDGVYSADPRIVPDAKKNNNISFDEMLEMSSLGAGVLYNRSVIMARKFKIPLHVRSSFREDNGTIIGGKKMEVSAIKGVTHNKDIAEVHISGLPKSATAISKLFSKIRDKGIHVSLILNVDSEGNHINFLIDKKHAKEISKIKNELLSETGAKGFEVNSNVATVSIVGDGIMDGGHVVSEVFRVLSDAKLDTRMITTSSLSITILTEDKMAEKMVKTLHEGLKLGS